MHRKFAISDSPQCPAYNILVLDTQSFNFLSVTPIAAMDNSEHGDEAEIAAFFHHSPGQPCLEHEMQDTAPQGAGLETSDETIRERERLSTNQIGGVFFHCLTCNFDGELDVITSDCFCG